MSASDVPLGAIVDVPAGRGIVRFNGTTEFAPGSWIGIELYEPKGKNNGTVQDIQYFKCSMPYGMFVRPSQVKVVSLEARGPSPVSVTTPAAPATPIVAVRPAIGHVRAASNGRVRTASLRNVAPPSPALSRSVSPQKPPHSAILTPSRPPASRMRPSGPSSPVKRTPLAPAATISSRQTFTRPRTGTAESVPSTPVSQKPRLAEPTRVESPLSVSPSNSHRTSSPPPPPLPAVNFNQSNSPLTQVARPPSSLVKEIQAEAEQETQELRAKIRVLEARRSDDARVIEKLESQLADINHFVALRPKLQQKLATLQQEIISNRRALADSEQVQALNESRVLDVQEQLEMAMLDKEVAEERAEAAEMELQSLHERLESLEIEVESMREGGTGSEVDGSIKSSLAYNQLEKHNDRLKEALIKLRDVSRETEQEQRHRIAELERELQGVEELHSQYDSTLGKLANAETQIDELKAQLDDALGAEEMLEQLTERNLLLGEKIAEMTITIEDLEALKELNDELEENHLETEKQLQEELEQKDSQNREQLRKISELEDACQDFEGTINQFRELVMQLQSELDALRTQTQNAQHESATAVSQTVAMMSLNIKLQSSASKNQARNIELELSNIEAKENKELYNIVRPYLPQLYVESDSEATQCYLYFQRMAAKADLINSVVATLHGLPEALNGPVSEALVRTCELRARISNLATMCKRLASVLKRGDVETFLSIGRFYPEIAPLERRIDLHIDTLRRDEFRDAECVSDVDKTVNTIQHLVEAYSEGFDRDLGEQELGLVLNFDHELDNFTASIALIHTGLSEIMKDEDVTIESENDAVVELIEPFKRLLDQVRGAKVMSRKLMKRLEDLIQDSAALKPHLIPQLRALNNKAPELVDFAFKLAHTILPLLTDIRNSKGTLQTKTVLNVVRTNALTTFNRKDDASLDVVSEAIGKLIQEASAVVPLAFEPENILKISAIPPWVIRVKEIKATLAVNVEAERKMAQLNEEIQGLARGIRSRDQTIQESSVKIELMERRMDTVKKQADAISSLETEIAKARKQERSYEEAIEQLQSDLDVLEQDNSKLKQLTAGTERQRSVGPQPVETENITAVESNLETSHLLEQIEALRGAVRYLRRENSYLKGQDLLKEVQALPPIPDFSSRPTTPLLDPSGSSSDSDSDSERPRTPSLRSLATETNVLYRDVIMFSSSPRVVDLSSINKKRTDTAHHGRGWMAKKLTPSHQLLERKLAAEELSKRVKGLLDKANSLGVAR